MVLRVLVLKVLKVLRVLRVPRRGLAVAAAVVLAVGVWIRCAPIPIGLLDGIDTPSTVVVDRHGRVLYEALSPDGSRVRPVDAASLPPVLEAATIAAEDRRFYSHPGVDPVSLLRAARHNLGERRVVEGGSTITQQVAKLLIQRREGVRHRGVSMKVREMILALRLEHRFSKREVLAMYLNLAAYGNQTAGAGRASQLYFGVDPSMLTPAQAAFLAALPQRPSAFNPLKNIASARVRQQTVLRRMAAAGALSPERLREARAEQVALRPRGAAFSAPHFVEMVSTFAKATVDRSTFAKATVDRSTFAKATVDKSASAGDAPPARIVTTLDLDLQREVEGILEHERESLRAHGAGNVAVVVLDNARGEWLAWEGSGNYGDTGHGGALNGPLVPRQPGSALKPFTYALAFEQGRDPASVLPDIPSHFPTAEPGVLYSPRNYDGQYRGPLLARRALGGSENVPAVALASDIGVSTLLRFLDRAGFSTFDRTPAYYGLGVTLGNAEVRLDQLVAAYAMFARGGVWREPTFLLPPEGGSHESSLEKGGSHENPPVESRGFRLQAEERQVVSPRTAFWITDILSDPEARAFTFGRGNNLEFPFPVAAKTGTSQAYHDNWTIGYTRDVTVGVWVGNFDRTPLHLSSGVTGAGPIFHAVMLAANRGRASMGAHEILAPPPDVHEVTICALSGMRANAWCPSRAREWVSETGDAVPCAWHHRSDEGLLTIYPPEFRAWAADAGGRIRLAADSDEAPASPPASPKPRSGEGGKPRSGEGGTLPGAVDALAIANPPAGAIYSVDPTLRREFQALPFRAVAGRPTTVTWLVDGASVGTASSERTLSWPLVIGRHDIEARDANGRRARTSVIIK
jgi:penicillin-binding protein 1C